jgi:ABC-2 type transport system ATP-binding protein
MVPDSASRVVNCGSIAAPTFVRCGGTHAPKDYALSTGVSPGHVQRVLGSRSHRSSLGDVAAPPTAAAIAARAVSRSFGPKRALDGISLGVRAGEIHALIGPNGAGKTTLLRLLNGLVAPDEGEVAVLGHDPSAGSRALRGRIGLIPSGDRSFYLRISGLENLVFFARLHGMGRREALARARRALEKVDLADAARLRVGAYSHGMQKRLSIARALLTDLDVLLVDEATHDLDPQGARRVRELVRAVARGGTAVVWTTQHLDELRGFADVVTVLSNGSVRFTGTVPEFMAHSLPRRYVLRLQNGRLTGESLEPLLQQAVEGLGMLTATADGDSPDYLLVLAENAVLGDALASLASKVQVLSCREERSEIEEAFLSLTADTEGRPS